MKRTAVFLIAFLCIATSAAASPADFFKGFLAVSTSELEELKKDAMVKVFPYDFDTCYEKTLSIIRKMPDTTIYAQRRDLIAVYCTSLNSTPVGVFFEKVDQSNTKVLLSSPSSRAKDWVAANVFSEKVQKPLERFKIK